MGTITFIRLGMGMKSYEGMNSKIYFEYSIRVSGIYLLMAIDIVVYFVEDIFNLLSLAKAVLHTVLKVCIYLTSVS